MDLGWLCQFLSQFRMKPLNRTLNSHRNLSLCNFITVSKSALWLLPRATATHHHSWDPEAWKIKSSSVEVWRGSPFLSFLSSLLESRGSFLPLRDAVNLLAESLSQMTWWDIECKHAILLARLPVCWAECFQQCFCCRLCSVHLVNYVKSIAMH